MAASLAISQPHSFTKCESLHLCTSPDYFRRFCCFSNFRPRHRSTCIALDVGSRVIATSRGTTCPKCVAVLCLTENLSRKGHDRQRPLPSHGGNGAHHHSRGSQHNIPQARQPSRVKNESMSHLDRDWFRSHRSLAAALQAALEQAVSSSAVDEYVRPASARHLFHTTRVRYLLFAMCSFDARRDIHT